MTCVTPGPHYSVHGDILLSLLSFSFCFVCLVSFLVFLLNFVLFWRGGCTSRGQMRWDDRRMGGQDAQYETHKEAMKIYEASQISIISLDKRMKKRDQRKKH